MRAPEYDPAHLGSDELRPPEARLMPQSENERQQKNQREQKHVNKGSGSKEPRRRRRRAGKKNANKSWRALQAGARAGKTEKTRRAVSKQSHENRGAPISLL